MGLVSANPKYALEEKSECKPIGRPAKLLKGVDWPPL